MDVYEPHEDSYFLLDVLKKQDLKGIIAEIGCGSCLISNSLKLTISTDINRNALLNSKALLKIRSNLLQNLKNIDIVIFNPPYLEGTDIRYGGGITGNEIIYEFINQLKIPTVYLLITRFNNPEIIKSKLIAKSYNVEEIAIKKVLGETLIILKCLKK